MIAPFHPYDPTTQTGLAWTPATVTLHARLPDGTPTTVTRPHATPSAHAFWQHLAWAERFPEVTHWWSGDAWTGNVRFAPATALTETVLTGVLQCGTADAPSVPYEIDLTTLTVAAPLPPRFATPRNLALRRILSELILAPVAVTIAAQLDRPDLLTTGWMLDPRSIQPDTWIGVTSLVPPEALGRMFPHTAPWWTLPPYGLGTSWRDRLVRSLGVA